MQELPLIFFHSTTASQCLLCVSQTARLYLYTILILTTTFEDKYYYSHTEVSEADPAANTGRRQGFNPGQADTEISFSHDIKMALIPDLLH